MEELRRILIEVLPRLKDVNIHESMNLKEDLGIDSIRLVQILVEIEEKLMIELSEDDLNPSKLITVSNLVELIKVYKGN